MHTVRITSSKSFNEALYIHPFTIYFLKLSCKTAFYCRQIWYEQHSKRLAYTGKLPVRPLNVCLLLSMEGKWKIQVTYEHHVAWYTAWYKSRKFYGWWWKFTRQIASSLVCILQKVPCWNGWKFLNEINCININ